MNEWTVGRPPCQHSLGQVRQAHRVFTLIVFGLSPRTRQRSVAVGIPRGGCSPSFQPGLVLPPFTQPPRLVHRSIHWSIHWFIHWYIGPFTDPFIGPLVHSAVHSLVHRSIHSSTHTTYFKPPSLDTVPSLSPPTADCKKTTTTTCIYIPQLEKRKNKKNFS